MRRRRRRARNIRKSLRDILYTTGIRLPKHMGLQRATGISGERVLRRLGGLTKVQHEQLALHHAKRAKQKSGLWSRAADRAAQRTFGRPFRAIFDYKISGIGRDEFSPKDKSALRRLAQDASKHSSLARAHWLAAGHRKLMRARNGRKRRSRVYGRRRR